VSIDDPARRTPITIVTGFLGAGKTTLINRILTEGHGRRVAVVENEFGEVGIDGALVMGADEEIFELNNGCVCCAVRGDLIRTVTALTSRRLPFDRIIIETSGLADPAPVIQTFLVDHELMARCRLDAIVTVVDARHASTYLGPAPANGDLGVALRQVAVADRVVVSKSDLVPPGESRAVERRLRSLNPSAELIRGSFGEVPLGSILDVQDADLGVRAWLAEPTPSTDDHGHSDELSSIGIEFAEELDGQRFLIWLRTLVREHGASLLRTKGVVALAGQDARLVFHSVHMVLDIQQGLGWESDEARGSRMVFIGRDLDHLGLRSAVAACTVL